MARQILAELGKEKALAPRLGLYREYQNRIDYFEVNPPAKDWTGAWTADEK